MSRAARVPATSFLMTCAKSLALALVVSVSAACAPASDRPEGPGDPKPGDGEGGGGGAPLGQGGGNGGRGGGGGGSSGRPSEPGGTGGGAGRGQDAGPRAPEGPDEPTPDGADAGARTDAAPRPPVTVGDAGARDAKVPPPAVPTGGDAPPCRFHFCDSFEQGDDGASPPGWSKNANVVLGTTHVARGKKALRVRNGGINPANFVTRAMTIPAGASTIYGRLFLRFESRPQSMSLVHWTATEVRGSGGPSLRALGGISQAAFSGRNNLMFNIDPGGGERSVEDAFPRPGLVDKEWQCLEFMLTRGAKDEAQIFWNGERRPKLYYDGSWGARFKFPTFEQLALGFATYQNAGSFEVWIDELAIDDERVGCEP